MGLERKGILVILSSPSGGGKTSIYRKILEMHPEYTYSVSVTTRPPRVGEENGSEYHFVSDDKFNEYINENAFLEWANVHNNRYGTLKETVNSYLSKSKIVFLDIDVQGTLNIKKQIPESVSIFILPPTFDKLMERLIARKTDSPEVLKTRIKNAVTEVSYWSQYDYLVINDKFENTVKTVEAIVTAELNKTSNYTDFKWEIPVEITEKL